MNIVNKDLTGYTVIIKDKYILCGTSRSSHWKPIDDIGTSKVRQYYSLKILFNNLGHHFTTWGSRDFEKELKAICCEHGWLHNNGYTMYPSYFSKELLSYLVETGWLKVVKVKQVLSLEEVPDVMKELK